MECGRAGMLTSRMIRGIQDLIQYSSHTEKVVRIEDKERLREKESTSNPLNTS